MAPSRQASTQEPQRLHLVKSRTYWVTDSLLGALQLGAFHGDAVAGAGAFAELAGETDGFARLRVAHQLDVAPEPLRHLQGFMRIVHGDRRLEELADGDPHAREQAVEPGGNFFEGILHAWNSFIMALERMSVTSETGIRIFQERLSSP